MADLATAVAENEALIGIGVLAGEWAMGTLVYHERDLYRGTVQGYYVTREGRVGLVVQQSSTKVVHVYHTQWLTRLASREGG